MGISKVQQQKLDYNSSAQGAHSYIEKNNDKLHNIVYNNKFDQKIWHNNFDQKIWNNKFDQ